MNTIFENDHFFIADKPAGWLTVPSRWSKEDLRPSLSIWLPIHAGVQLTPVHRLDVEVTGLVMFAKTHVAMKAASEWFANKRIQKTYEAWTEGFPSPWGLHETQMWRSQILRGKKRAYESPEGKNTETRAKWAGKITYNGQEFQKWYLEPLTGRGHQLRFELSKRGHPIVGDSLYGAQSTFTTDAIALRAFRLNFSNCPEARKLGLPSEIGIESLHG